MLRQNGDDDKHLALLVDVGVNDRTDALNQRGKAVMGSRVLVLGIAYKKDVEDMRESPSVELMEILRDKGAVVDYADPHVPVFPRMREHHFDLKSVELTPQRIASYDVVLLATAHSAFDYDLVRQYASLIVDTMRQARTESMATMAELYRDHLPAGFPSADLLAGKLDIDKMIQQAIALVSEPLPGTSGAGS